MSQALDVRVKQNIEENSTSSVAFQKYVEWTDNMSFILAIATTLKKKSSWKGKLYIKSPSKQISLPPLKGGVR